jgi:tRNA A37 threonylcarbamoyladenosine synthetase subunit TsaC/SUA5/YrdC
VRDKRREGASDPAARRAGNGWDDPSGRAFNVLFFDVRGHERSEAEPRRLLGVRLPKTRARRPVTSSDILHLGEQADRVRAVEQLLGGELIVSGFNGIYVLLGDADDPSVPNKVASAKRRPQAKGVALVCPPEVLGEHVNLKTPALREHDRFARVQALQRGLHALGVILPAAMPGAPGHVVQSGTILNVWTEQPPHAPLRQLVGELRRRGRRALAGTSANLSGKPTITDADEVIPVFGQRVATILLEDVDALPPRRRRSATIVDFTQSQPHLLHEGSVPAGELAAELRRFGLGELVIGADVRRV